MNKSIIIILALLFGFVISVSLWWGGANEEYWSNYRYFYSALFQASAALVSIILIVAVFRLQALSSAVDENRKAVEDIGHLDRLHKLTRFIVGVGSKYSRAKRRSYIAALKSGLDKLGYKDDNPYRLYLKNHISDAELILDRKRLGKCIWL